MSITALKLEEDLEEAGAPKARARLHAKAHEITLERAREGLATKEDLDIATTKLEAKIVATKKDLDATITNLEVRLEAKIEATKGELSEQINALRGDIGALKEDLFKWGAGAMLVLLVTILGSTLGFIHTILRVLSATL